MSPLRPILTSAKEGCHVAVVCARSMSDAESVAKDLARHQVTAAAFACDDDVINGSWL